LALPTWPAGVNGQSSVDAFVATGSRSERGGVLDLPNLAGMLARRGMQAYDALMRTFITMWSYPIVVITVGVIVLGGRALLPTVAQWHQRLEDDLARSMAEHEDRA